MSDTEDLDVLCRQAAAVVEGDERVAAVRIDLDCPDADEDDPDLSIRAWRCGQCKKVHVELDREVVRSEPWDREASDRAIFGDG